MKVSQTIVELSRRMADLCGETAEIKIQKTSFTIKKSIYTKPQERYTIQ
ncbi:hypothetical protein [Bergeyella porcorum]